MNYRIFIFFISTILVQGDHGATVETLVNIKEQNEDGYHFEYSTGDGQRRQETGTLENYGDNSILRLTGSYSYISSDGKSIEVLYEADAGGYRPRVRFLSSQSAQPIPKSPILDKQPIENQEQLGDGHSSLNQVSKTQPQGTDVDEINAGSTTNLTTPTGLFPPLIPAPISSPAIASLAGGGLG